MDVERYRRLILKRWPVIVACVLFTGIGAALGTQFLPKLYQGQVRVQVDFSATDPSVVVGITQLVTTEVQDATSGPVLTQVAAKYPDLTEKQLSGEVTAAAFTGSQLFIITVLDASPTRAVSLANDIADVLIANQRDVLAADNAQAQQQVRQSIADTRTQLAAAKALVASLTAQKADPSAVAAAQANVDSLQQQETQLLATLSAIQEAQARKSSFLHIADPATPSATPKRPYLLLNVGIGLAVGLVLGLLLLALLDLLDQRVRSVRDVLELLEWPVLAEVGIARGGDASSGGIAYQELVTNLAFFDVERPLRTLCVASATRGDDAGALAAQLALSTASAGKRTLLVDADLAHSSQAQRFGVPEPTGLSTAILESHGTQGRAIRLDAYMFAPVSVQAPMLRILPAGPKPPNPSGLLKSRAAMHLVQAIGGSGADIAIFGAPPLHRNGGVTTLAKETDGVLVVVGVASARKDQLLSMKAQLVGHGAAVLGCVITSAGPGHNKPGHNKPGHNKPGRNKPSRNQRQHGPPQRPTFVPQPGVVSTTGSPTGLPRALR
jgi:capsular polysaccharide biosynthesis protein